MKINAGKARALAHFGGMNLGGEKTRVHEAAEREVYNKPVFIRNRDIPILADVIIIMQDVCNLEQRRMWQRDRMQNITQHLSKMPRGGGIKKGFDDAFAMLSEIDTEHEEKCREYVCVLRTAQKILNGIESRSMRSFVAMKYMMDLPDTDIRRDLNMTRRGFERARRCVEEAESMKAVKWHERYILMSKENF